MKPNKNKGLLHIGLCTGLLALGLAQTASASTVITLANSLGVTDQIFGVTPISTGADMVGLLSVTVFLTSGGPQVVTFANTAGCTQAALCGEADGAITGGHWTLTESSNTGLVGVATSPDTSGVFTWSLTNTSTTVGITSVLLNGVVSPTQGVVFDRDFFCTNITSTTCATSGGQEGTPGGVGGLDFTFFTETGGNSPYTVTVQYSNIAAITAAAPCRGSNWSGFSAVTGCGDEWGTVSYSFGSSFVALSTLTPTQYFFFQDTDQVGAPEPFTVGLTGLGLAALIVYGKRRLAKKSV